MVQPHRPATDPSLSTCPNFFLIFFSPPLHYKQQPQLSAQQQSEMGTGKKEAQRKIRQGKVGDGMGNVKVKGENFYR